MFSHDKNSTAKVLSPAMQKEVFHYREKTSLERGLTFPRVSPKQSCEMFWHECSPLMDDDKISNYNGIIFRIGKFEYNAICGNKHLSKAQEVLIQLSYNSNGKQITP